MDDNIALRYAVGQCAVLHQTAGFLFGRHITSLKVKGITNYGAGAWQGTVMLANIYSVHI